MQDHTPNIAVFADFEKDDYEGWKAEGTAFGSRPFRKSELPKRQALTGNRGKGFVNTHDSREGEDSPRADMHVDGDASNKGKMPGL